MLSFTFLVFQDEAHGLHQAVIYQHQAHGQLFSGRCLSQARVAHFFCVTVMFRNPADGLRADRASGAARCRQYRRLRAFLKHERVSLAMQLATVYHYSRDKSDSNVEKQTFSVGVQAGVPWSERYHAQDSRLSQRKVSRIIRWIL